MDLSFVQDRIRRSIAVKERVLQDCSGQILACGEMLVQCIGTGGKILFCGNGGSAADAQHLAAELVVKLGRERRALPAIALTTDSSILTAAANDFSFDGVFARQVQALGAAEDVLIGISTSGNSENVYQAIIAAQEKGMGAIALLGKDGGKIRTITEHALVVPDEDTQRIQESQLMIGHIWMEMIDAALEKER